MTALDMHSSSHVSRHTVAERRIQGTMLRRGTPRSAHAGWSATPARANPVAILTSQNLTRLPDLVPLRYARMRPSAFTFLRGAAAVMAADLARTPTSGLMVQACGDCHLANFGAYASPEGEPVFDINDFDETLPAPFEWDLKRLATSLVVAGEDRGMSETDSADLAQRAVLAYASALDRTANLSPLAAWNTRVDVGGAVHDIPKARVRTEQMRRLAAVMSSHKESFGLVEAADGGWRIREKPPLVYRLSHRELPSRQLFDAYAATLEPARRVLLDRYRLRDVAFKVVGVGSVGTFCAIGLFTDADGHLLLLQIKEAQQSVLAPYAGASRFANAGERVVVGQRIMQAASDIFLGWTVADGRQFYVRALKDGRLAAVGEAMTASLPFYAGLCGRTLARAHARSGDAAAMSGYIGNGPAFARAITGFAVAYARQNTADWKRFCAAIESGEITASDVPLGQS